MKKTLLIIPFVLTGFVSFSQVQTSARKVSGQPAQIQVKEEPVSEPDSVSVMSTGRFAKPVVIAAPANETKTEPETTKASSARRPD